MCISKRPAGMRIVAALALVILGMLSACAPSTHTVSKATVTGCSATSSAATQSAQDMLNLRACQAAGSEAVAVRTIYDQQAASVKVTIRIGGRVPDTDAEVSAAQNLTKTICLREQQAIWASGVTLKEATVTVIGPIQDEYANIVDGSYGASVLHPSTVAGLNWASLSAESAWGRYDYTFLRPYYVLFD